MMMTKEKGFLKAACQLNGLIQKLRDTTSERADEIEQTIFRDLMGIGFSLLQQAMENAGDGDRGSQVERNGQVLRRSARKRTRRYVSVFGEHRFRRYVYLRREKQRAQWKPWDEQLGLPAQDHSYLVQQWSQRMCLKESFAEAKQSLQDLLGVTVPVASLEKIAAAMAQDVDAFRMQRPAPSGDEEILVYANDCKGVPIRRSPEQPHKRLRRRGEKVQRKRMACVGVAYSIARHQRTADDILQEVRRKAAHQERPRPKNKRIWAELTHAEQDEEQLHSKTVVFAEQAIDLQQRDPHESKTVVCLMDGERALWNARREWLGRSQGILDLYHVLERLWKCANCFHREGTPEAEAFVDHRLRMLLDGKVGYVIGRLKRLAASPGLSGEKRKILQRAWRFFENNRDYMRYDEYLAQGLPIGSGVVEGACRHVVKDRLEQTGMRWTPHGAQHILDLRSTYLNEDWQDYMRYHVERDQNRLYRQAAA